MIKGRRNSVWTSFVKPSMCVVFAMGLLGACSNEQESQAVSKQKLDNPAVAVDRVANPSYEPNNIATDNPFVQASDEPVRAAKDNDQIQSDDKQEGYSINESDYVSDSVVFRGNDSGYVEWQAPIEIEYVVADVVVITPNGKRLTRSYSAGEPIVLDENLPDGFYSWESVITPEIDRYAREEMTQARESGNLQEQQALMKKLRNQGSMPTQKEARKNRQSGAFIVKGGVAISIEAANKAADQLNREDG